jgi:hypothetical protein
MKYLSMIGLLLLSIFIIPPNLFPQEINTFIQAGDRFLVKRIGFGSHEGIATDKKTGLVWSQDCKSYQYMKSSDLDKFLKEFKRGGLS